MPDLDFAPRNHRALRVAAAALALALASCSTAPIVPPVGELPAGDSTIRITSNWWTEFKDPKLDALVAEALAANLDLRAAAARVDEAGALLRAARSGLYPNVDLAASAGRQRQSQVGSQPLTGIDPVSNNYNVGLRASYEVDLWGRIRSGANAAGETLAATEFDREAIRIAVAAETARGYFSLVSADAELAVLRDTLATREESVQLQLDRYQAGVASEFELRSAEAERASVTADVATATRVQKTIESALAVLLGRSPRAVYTPAVDRSEVARAAAIVPEVPAGLPSDLLAQRPDIRRSEAQLRASDFRVSEARSYYFPSLVLTGTYGSESAQLGNLFTGPAAVWSLAASLTQPIFSAGLIQAQVEATEARREQAIVGYQQTVQVAFREAHDAFVAHRTAREVFVAQTERRDRLAQALELAQLRYQAGYSPYVEVLDSQRTLLRAETDRIIAARNLRTSIVDINKSLGGGWQFDQVAAAR
jgi:multidrug efflux system outer membrane protein